MVIDAVVGSEGDRLRAAARGRCAPLHGSRSALVFVPVNVSPPAMRESVEELDVQEVESDQLERHHVLAVPAITRTTRICRREMANVMYLATSAV
jgi:hypothetical protein